MRWLVLSIFSLLLTLQAQAAPGEDVDFEGAAPAPIMEPAGAPPAPEDVDQLAAEIGRQLRCPVCQGMSVADSTSSAAVMMFNHIKGQVEQGYTEDQIKEYWITRYGEWILLNPTGRHWIVWMGPVVMIGGGLLWMTFVFRRWRYEPGAKLATPTSGDVALDSYEQKLLDELED